MTAVDAIARSPLFQGVSVHIVTVGSVTPEVIKVLEGAKVLLKVAGIHAETSILPGQLESALGKLAEEAQFDILEMGANRHSRLCSLIIGSTTASLIRSRKVPVVLMRCEKDQPNNASLFAAP